MVKNQEYQIATKKHLAIIAPLDWGLGHTTRCIPIIHQLKENNFDIIIACNSAQKSVLQAEFPDLVFVHLDGYGLKYGNSRFSTIIRLCFQVPKILISIKRENLQFKRILNQFTPNIIISDNRYGVFSSSIQSIFITHQLKIITGAGRFADLVAKAATHRLIRRFDQCWIPDFEGSHNLAGDLSNPGWKPTFNVRYIGPLSRFKACYELRRDDGTEFLKTTFNNSDSSNEPVIDTSAEVSPVSRQEANHPQGQLPVPDADSAESDVLSIPGLQLDNQCFSGPEILVVLSGPEPQRTRLESILVAQLKGYRGEVIIVRGLPLETRVPETSSGMRMINYADSRLLNELICKSGIVICRSGYTSVMDLAKLGKRAVLIPTPGQAEQEYLAAYLEQKNMAVIGRQEKLDIVHLISRAENIRFPQFDSMDAYKNVISQLATDIQEEANQHHMDKQRTSQHL